MPVVLFKGGPFDGRRAHKPGRDHLALECGVEGDAIKVAKYSYEDPDYVFRGCEFRYRLVGGPFDGTEYPVRELKIEPGDSLVVPFEAKYAWYKPAGRGRYEFDGFCKEDNLEEVV